MVLVGLIGVGSITAIVCGWCRGSDAGCCSGAGREGLGPGVCAGGPILVGCESGTGAAAPDTAGDKVVVGGGWIVGGCCRESIPLDGSMGWTGAGCIVAGWMG